MTESVVASMRKPSEVYRKQMIEAKRRMRTID